MRLGKSRLSPGLSPVGTSGERICFASKKKREDQSYIRSFHPVKLDSSPLSQGRVILVVVVDCLKVAHYL